MTSPVAIRLDRALRQRVERLARQRGKTRTEIMREALEAGLREQEKQKVRPYELMKGALGIIRTGDPKGSEDMGRKLTEFVRKKHNQS